MAAVITDCGSHERLKLAVHGGLLGLALTCVFYNVLAYYRRREGHLGRNVVIYSALAGYEVVVMAHHCGESK